MNIDSRRGTGTERSIHESNHKTVGMEAEEEGLGVNLLNAGIKERIKQG